MRVGAGVVILLLAAGAAAAQRHKVSINTETPEGQILQQIGSETDAAKKLALMEQFAAQHPKHEAIAWVLEQLIPAETKAGNFDKAMDAGEKLLAVDPEDARSAHETLKAAEAKKDPDAILKWSNATSAVARKIAASPKPQDEDDVETWKSDVDFAKQLDIYTEYSLYAAVLQSPDPQKRIMLAEALEKRNPDSQYFDQVAEQWFVALLQAQRGEEAVALADRMIAKGKGSVEMVLAAAGSALGKKQFDGAIELSNKALEKNAAAPKPEGVSDADWQNRKSMLAGRAKWIIGLAYAGQSKWALADKTLREAVPAVQSDKDMLAEALFNLGVANYRLGEAGDTDRIKDALAFSQQCAAIPGRFQGPANTNIKAIRSRYRIK